LSLLNQGFYQHLKIVIDYPVNFTGIQVLPSQSFSHAIRGMLRGENQVHLPGEPLFDFLKPFKGNTYMPVILQSLFSIDNLWGSLTSGFG